MRFSQVSIALLAAAGCASVPVRVEADLQELKMQVAAQSAQIAAQQRRIEELEVKLAAVAARSEIRPKSAVEKPAPAEKATMTGAPARDPRPQLKTVKLGEGRRHRRDYNPVERAPSLPASIALKEPDQDALERLEAAQIEPGIQEELDADHSFAQAVKKLNDGQLREAETELLWRKLFKAFVKSASKAA